MLLYLTSVVALITYKSGLVHQTAGGKKQQEGNEQVCSSKRLWFEQDSTYGVKIPFALNFGTTVFCTVNCSMTSLTAFPPLSVSVKITVKTPCHCSLRAGNPFQHW